MELERSVIINRWLPQLSQKTGLPVATLKTEGLRAGDFPPAGVRIDFEDGSLVHFCWAFFVSDPARPRKVAIFTEHCGYHEFLLGSEDTIAQLEPAASA
ncbi:hypothetical protein [Malikia spinosa]|uniref:Uncharacterized protein n=1 Tax=Malikia spinosa TaxID=86180 RepID=A0A7C9MRS0_9BURK|nr:hypothetical protein [Malikia spinosa]MYZ52118.1 hypothetical protein [Malikia spinosa]